MDLFDWLTGRSSIRHEQAGRVCISRDSALRGSTRLKVSCSNQLFLYPKDFAVHRGDTNAILVGTCDSNWQDKSGGLYRTEDGGRTWQRIGRKGRQTFGGYSHPKYGGWIYMTLTEGAPCPGFWLTHVDGRTREAFENLPFSNIQRVVFDPQTTP